MHHASHNSRSAHGRLQLDEVKKTIWLTRPDLRQLLQGDRDRFELWLVLNGSREYEAIAELGMTVSESLLSEPAPEASPHAQLRLTRFMKAVWSTRPDIQTAFDLCTPESQDNFAWWYFLHGTAELGLARFVTEDQRARLNEVELGLPNSGFLPITRLMIQVWQRRPDLQQAFDLRMEKARDAFLAWYFTRGMVELRLAYTVDKHQARALLSSTNSTSHVAKIMSLIWASDEKLQARFPDSSDQSFQDWARSVESQEAYPILRRLMEPAGPQEPIAPAKGGMLADLPFGVNLIGYAKGQFGIGEDVRMAALALEAAGVPFSIYNVEPGREVCQGDDSATSHISDALPYAVNVFCMTGIDTARIAALHGSMLFDGRYSIGYWPWELPEWPAEWHHSYTLIDEVWASSRFTFDAFVKSCPKPVRHMPMAVMVDQTAGLTRSDFRLQEDGFLFVFSFDFLSSVERKNPQACVEAFRRAFPRGDEPVGLVVKAMRAIKENPLWLSILDEAASDRRITIISNTLCRGALLDLYRACDCYVSLHRSEGFGRGIAEAMMIGRPIIATGHSGNMDFTLPGTAGLVSYRLRSLADNEYPFGGGQMWAEPDLDHAAWWMLRMADDHALRERLVKTAQTLINNTYAPSSVGETYSFLLKEVAATQTGKIED